jgi:hypothetical protein
LLVLSSGTVGCLSVLSSGTVGCLSVLSSGTVGCLSVLSFCSLILSLHICVLIAAFLFSFSFWITFVLWFLHSCIL